PELVAVVRVEIEQVVLVRGRLALEADADDALVVLLNRRLPVAPEGRDAGWHTQALDRPRTALADGDRAAADEPEPRVVEVVGVEVVDRDRVRAGAHVALVLRVTQPRRGASAAGLVGVVLADGAGVRHRVVRLAELRHE